MELEIENLKKTEFGVIPFDWELFQIQDLIDTSFIVGHLDGNHGALYPRSEEFTDFGIPYISANDFYAGKVEFSNCKHLTFERGKLFRKGIAKNGDVLFAHNATVGPVALLKTNHDFVILSTTATYFRCNKSKLLNTYLLYALQSSMFVKQYTSIMSQSTRFQVPITAQRKLVLFIPPLSEQTAIATALSDADALIRSLEQLIEKKKKIKQGTMQELLRPKKGWVRRKLGEIAHIIMGQSPLSIYYNSKGEGLPLIQGNADIEDRKTIIRNYTSVVTKKGKKGSIIMSVRAPVGEISRATFDCCLGRGVCSISFHNDFLYHYLINLERSWTKFSSGSTFDSINSSQVKDLEVDLPTSELEQNEISEILNVIDLEISAIESKLIKTRQIKQGMMQTLLTGKIRLI